MIHFRLSCLIWLCFVSVSTAYASEGLVSDDHVGELDLLSSENDLLLADELDFEAGATSAAEGSGNYSKVIDAFRLGIYRHYAIGDVLEQSLFGARVEVDSALWEGAYIRIDYEVNHYYSPDLLSRQNGKEYTHRDLKEAWLQLSHANCVVKLGRQTLFWGRVEGAYALDLVSPLDLTKPLLTDFSDIRLSSDMAVLSCFQGGLSGELFVQNDTKLNRISHLKSSFEKRAESTLGKEWGGRINHSAGSFEASLHFAQLYTNSISLLRNQVNFDTMPVVHKYDLYGISLGLNSGSIMYELDLAYRSDAIASAFLARDNDFDTEEVVDIALGFEYLSPSNHQINGGVWRFKQLDPIRDKTEYVDVYNLSWSKEYLNDLLGLSVLASWQAVLDVAGLNVSSEYDVSDYSQVALALSYVSRGDAVGLGSLVSDSKFRTYLKFELQF